MVYGKLPRTMPSTLEEWKNVCTLHNEAMAQQLAITLGYPPSWRACRYPRHTGRPDFIYDDAADDNAEEAGYRVPVGGPVAKFDVGDIVEIREEPVKPACAATNIMMAHTERGPQDLQWYRATITKKTEYLNDIRYKVQYSVDDTVESNVQESEMRATVVYDDEDDLIIDIVPIMTAYNIRKKEKVAKKVAKKASKGNRAPTKRQPRASKPTSPSKSGHHDSRLATPLCRASPNNPTCHAPRLVTPTNSPGRTVKKESLACMVVGCRSGRPAVREEKCWECYIAECNGKLIVMSLACMVVGCRSGRPAVREEKCWECYIAECNGK